MKTENTLIQRDHECTFFILKKHLGANHDPLEYFIFSTKEICKVLWIKHNGDDREHLHQFCQKHNTIIDHELQKKKKKNLVKLKIVFVPFSAHIKGHTSDVDYKKPWRKGFRDEQKIVSYWGSCALPSAEKLAYSNQE